MTVPRPGLPFGESRGVSTKRVWDFLQRAFEIKHGRISGPLCWAALLASVLVFYRVPVPGTESFINLSLFDLIAVLVLAIVAWRSGFRRPPIKFLAAAALVLAAVASHSLFMLLYDPGVAAAWLLRGTAKLAAILALFAVLVLVFRSESLGVPPKLIQRGVFATCILAGLSWNYFDLPFTPNTLLVTNNWLFFFLFLLGQKWPFSARRVAANLGITAALVVVSLVLLSKVGAIIGALIFISLLLSYLREEKKAGVIPAALAIGALGVATVFVLVDQTALLHRLDSVTQSVGVRMSLWSLAWTGITESFPLGIGLDQFATLVTQDATLSARQLKFPHSVPLGFIAELGLLGVGLIGLMIAVFWRAAKGYPEYLRPILLAIVVPLAFLHDIQGARLLLLVIAFGYARSNLTPNIASFNRK